MQGEAEGARVSIPGLADRHDELLPAVPEDAVASFFTRCPALAEYGSRASTRSFSASSKYSCDVNSYPFEAAGVVRILKCT